MAEADHQPEAYRVVFGLVGAAMFLVVLVFILVSGLVIPWYALGGLCAVWVAAAVASAFAWRSRPWLPLVAATLVAVAWILVLTAGSALMGWRP